MKSLFFNVMLFLGCLQILPAAPIAVVVSSGSSSHLLRGFERRILSDGARIEPRDVVVVDSGILILDMAGARWSMAEGSRFRLRKDAIMSVVELLSGQCFLNQPQNFPWRIETTQSDLQGSTAEVWVLLAEDHLEFSLLSGSLEWNSFSTKIQWNKVEEPSLFRLRHDRAFPMTEKKLDAMEKVVYREMLKAQSPSNVSGPQDLEGVPYLPKDEVIQAEVLRRAQLQQKRVVQEEHQQMLKDQVQRMESDRLRDFKEVIKTEGVFSFPRPLAPPPK